MGKAVARVGGFWVSALAHDEMEGILKADESWPGRCGSPGPPSIAAPSGGQDEAGATGALELLRRRQGQRRASARVGRILSKRLGSLASAQRLLDGAAQRGREPGGWGRVAPRQGTRQIAPGRLMAQCAVDNNKSGVCGLVSETSADNEPRHEANVDN